MKIKLRILYKKVVHRVKFLNPDKLDRARLADEMTKMAGHEVHRQAVSAWIRHGKVPQKYIPFLKKVDYYDVNTHRKPYRKSEKSVLKVSPEVK